MIVTGHAWLDWVIFAAAVTTALGVLWRKVLRPIGRFFRKFDHVVDQTLPRLTEIATVAPTLIEIAKEFRGDNGGSLRTVIDRLEALTEAQAVRFNELYTYTHNFRHEVKNGMYVIAGKQEIAHQDVLDALAASPTTEEGKP